MHVYRVRLAWEASPRKELRQNRTFSKGRISGASTTAVSEGFIDAVEARQAEAAAAAAEELAAEEPSAPRAQCSIDFTAAGQPALMASKLRACKIV